MTDEESIAKIRKLLAELDPKLTMNATQGLYIRVLEDGTKNVGCLAGPPDDPLWVDRMNHYLDLVNRSYRDLLPKQGE